MSRALFLCNLGYAIHSMLPNELNNVEEAEENDDAESIDRTKDENWEMHNMRTPASPRVPFTPRTMAFRTLDRKTPHTYA